LRVPFYIGRHRSGSVARAQLSLLTAQPEVLTVTPEVVRLSVAAAHRNAALAQVNAELRRQGLLAGWRDEACTVVDLDDGTPLCSIERAAARFWGTLTHGAHANGYVAGADGRPSHLWIACRSLSKVTDPGLYDNLVGGGVPHGESPAETLLREAFEEAGLSPAQLNAAVPAGVLRLHRDVAEGLQLEDLHAFDLPMAADLSPMNQDGEVSGFTCMPVPEALALAASTAMTVDAAIVTLDFGLRHGLLQQEHIRSGLALLRRCCSCHQGFTLTQQTAAAASQPFRLVSPCQPSRETP